MVDGATSVITAFDDGRRITLEANAVSDAFQVQSTAAQDDQIEITLVYFRQELRSLRLEPGPLEPRVAVLPPYLEAYAARVSESDSGTWRELTELPGRVTEVLYPDLATCREVVVGDHTLCLPNECRGCERTFCYSEPVRWAALDSPYDDDGVSAVLENGELWFYFKTHRWTATSTSTSSTSQGRGDHARVRLIDPWTPELATLSPISTASSVDLLWISRPQLTAEGSEILFDALHSEGGSRKVFLSHRESLERPWTVGALIIEGLARQDMKDAVLLPDRTNLLLWTEVPDHFTRYRRRTGTPGDVEFTLRDTVGFRLPAEDASARLSCDGWHLFFMSFEQGVATANRARILTLEPLVFDTPRRIDDLNPNGAWSFQAVGESPDCRAAYLTDGRALYTAERRTCSE
ncbi:MAG: hypothetical protein IT384_26290 [Deltaproteobacteria bacterium]|nr:hypothetical protein [Deltaproteobacteria bacterium]